jgi:hypothetical protein
MRGSVEAAAGADDTNANGDSSDDDLACGSEAVLAVEEAVGPDGNDDAKLSD